VHDLHGDRRALPAQYPTPQVERRAAYLSATHRVVNPTAPQPLRRICLGDLQNIKRGRNARCSLYVLQRPPRWAAHLWPQGFANVSPLISNLNGQID
jgi:hypothetical protein